MRVGRSTTMAAAMLGALLAATPGCTEERSPAPAPPSDAARAPRGSEITCAIDGMKMPLGDDTPSLEYGGKTYYFCDESEKRTFLAAPERYARP